MQDTISNKYSTGIFWLSDLQPRQSRNPASQTQGNPQARAVSNQHPQANRTIERASPSNLLKNTIPKQNSIQNRSEHSKFYIPKVVPSTLIFRGKVQIQKYEEIGKVV